MSPFSVDFMNNFQRQYYLRLTSYTYILNSKMPISCVGFSFGEQLFYTKDKMKLLKYNSCTLYATKAKDCK